MPRLFGSLLTTNKFIKWAQYCHKRAETMAAKCIKVAKDSIKNPTTRHIVMNNHMKKSRMAFPDDLVGNCPEVCKILKKDKWSYSFNPFGPQLKKAQIFLENQVKS